MEAAPDESGLCFDRANPEILMQKYRTAYLLQPPLSGFGMRVSLVVVLVWVKGARRATVALVNANANGTAFVPRLSEPMCVSVDDLASTRLKALAKISLKLRDCEESRVQSLAHLESRHRA